LTDQPTEKEELVCTECGKQMQGDKNPTAEKLQNINTRNPGIQFTFPVCCSCLNRRHAGKSIKWDRPIFQLEKLAENAVEFNKYQQFAFAVQDVEKVIAGMDKEQGRLVDEIGHLERRKRTVQHSLARMMKLMQDCPHAQYFIRRLEANKAISDHVLRARVMRKDGHKCRTCQTTKHLSIDHIIPVVAGGGDEESNLQVLCRRCNSRKGARVCVAA
jgi:hypothetical protein